MFDKLVQVLVLGAAYERIADASCSATTMRRRRDEWIDAGVFRTLEQACLDSYDKMIGLDLANLVVDGCIVKAPCGGEAAGRSPVDRGKQGTKRSLLVDGNGIPLGRVTAAANRNDSLLLAPTLEKLSRFGFHLPENITVHLNAGYDNGKTRDLLAALGCEGIISNKGRTTTSWETMGYRENQLLAQPRLPQTPHLHRATRTSHRRVHSPRQRHHHHPTPAHRSMVTLPLWDTKPTRQP